MLQKFVFWTGASDFLVGAGTMAGGLMLSEGDRTYFVSLMTLGMFLMMAAGLLMWASHDMKTRAPVMFWQGLVRLTAVTTVLIAVPMGWADQWQYALVAFDGTIGAVYIWGAYKVSDYSTLDFALGRSA
jgi:hypothetical protein